MPRQRRIRTRADRGIVHAAETAARRNVAVYQLTGVDVGQLDALASALTSVSAIDRDDFWLTAATLAQEIPRPLREKLNAFRLTEDACLLLVRGYPIDDEALGPTPEHWSHRASGSYVTRLEALLTLCSCVLGDPIGWASQQASAIVQDIVPIMGDDWSQISSASRAALTLHTEDAFHPCRGDYVALMCLRNPDAVPTLYACITDVALPSAVTRVLFEPRFAFRRDDSHSPPSPDTDGEGAQDAGGGRMGAVLFGAPESPYMRIDSYFMNENPDDPVATAGLAALEDALGEKTSSVALAPGDILFIDNYRAVHGRAAFAARYDGGDRWLKRTNIVRDLRRSRHVRESPMARTILGESRV